MGEIQVSDEVIIEDMIYEIRGMQVMLDSDLAKLYKCVNGTKDINKAVKRNIERFPGSFSFQLTNEEYDALRFQIGTSKLKGGRRYNPYVFTEQGVAMLSSILHSEKAIQMSIKIINAFVMMRQYMGKNEYRLSNLETKIIDNENNIKQLQEAFSKFEEKRKDNEIYFNGQIFDAYYKVCEIFKSAREKLIIIDSYADNTILDIIKRLNIKVSIITKTNGLLTKQDITKYNMQYHNLKIIYDETFHDRYFILDNHLVYHCGTSVNRIGYKTFGINLISDNYVCNLLIKKVITIVK